MVRTRLAVDGSGSGDGTDYGLFVILMIYILFALIFRKRLVVKSEFFHRSFRAGLQIYNFIRQGFVTWPFPV